MAEIDVETIGEKVLTEIKSKSWFPYKTGNLKFNATRGYLVDDNTYCIEFDSSLAPYVASLEEGSSPHDIPNAFGKGMEYGIGGNFEGKFHPGSTKHKKFISVKCVNTIVNYICDHYKGELK